MKEHWRTYTARQANQILSGLQYLLDGNVLDEEETKLARGIQLNLRRAASTPGEEYTMIPFSDPEEKLLQQVEDTLWR